jgi:hypothetical protein
MARPERFELPTLWFEARCSDPLSYGRVGTLSMFMRVFAKRAKGKCTVVVHIVRASPSDRQKRDNVAKQDQYEGHDERDDA